MIYGYVRESSPIVGRTAVSEEASRAIVSIREQGRSIIAYCQKRLGCKFDPKFLFMDSYSGKNQYRIHMREAASVLLNRVKSGDHILIHSFSHLFIAHRDITTWTKCLKDSEVSLHIISRGKEFSEMTSGELIDCLNESKAESIRGRGMVRVLKWQDYPKEKTRWVWRRNIDDRRHSFVKIVEVEGRVVQVAEH
jgi:Resolvase, N terminal domain